jgi:hypothetical protein
MSPNSLGADEQELMKQIQELLKMLDPDQQ